MNLFEFINELTSQELAMSWGDAETSRFAGPEKVEYYPCVKCGRRIPVPPGRPVPPNGLCAECREQYKPKKR